MPSPGREDRRYWVEMATRLAAPVLEALAAGRLRQTMPVESSGADRADFSHLEALGRLLCGLAPWLELPDDDTEEGRLRERFRRLAQQSLGVAVEPASADFLNFFHGQQPIVDAAFLAQALLRAPRTLWAGLSERPRRNLTAALLATRSRKPAASNWLLFSAMTESALFLMGENWDRMRVDYALRQHLQWYVGDGAYSDGPHFHWDYYNGFVIQPMLVDIMTQVGDEEADWRGLSQPIFDRARRFAAVQERLIAPDGTFPPLGRSLTYRCGAFHALAQSALRRDLPPEVSPAQVRGALSAVIRRTLDVPGTFDENGWLQIGLAGHQPGLGEPYISTGSLYLCAAVLLPLGLPPDDPFWTGPAEDWTAKKLWRGDDAAADHAL